MAATLRTMDYADLLSRNRRAFFEKRILQAVMVELTHRCNLRCVHCYCPPRASSRGELSAEEFGRVFDQLASAGTMQVFLTGGDPLLRPDFPEIYLAAKKRGFLVTVYTNGALITDEIIDLWASHWPRRIEISLYGRSEAVYRAVTQVPGAHGIVYQNVRKLVARGIPLELKSMALTLTRDEIYEMKAFADELGVRFRFDGRVHPRIDGSYRPLAYRLDPRSLAELEAGLPEGLDQLRRSHTEAPRADSGNESIFMCGAGIIAAEIDPYGRLHLCTIFRKPGYDLLAGELPESWNGSMKALRETPMGEEAKARQAREGWVEKCPAFDLLETGNVDRPSAFIRQLAAEEKRLALDSGDPCRTSGHQG